MSKLEAVSYLLTIIVPIYIILRGRRRR